MCRLTCLTCALCLLVLQACHLVRGAAPSAAVVGAGVNGLLAAIELKHRGWNVTVFEKATIVLPIIPTINLNGINYEYYNQAIFSSATFVNSGPDPALLDFANKYQQVLLPWTPSGSQLYYDTVTGPQPYPAVWAPFFETASGETELAQQLAEALDLINSLGANLTTQQTLLYPDETILEWSDGGDLPAYSGIAETWWYAVRACSCIIHMYLQPGVSPGFSLN